jgi:predicted metalloendopeptidase
MEVLSKEFLNPLKKSSVSLTAKIHLYEPSKSIKPGQSFYRYVNHEWLSKTKIPQHLVRYSVGNETEEYIDTFLYKIILDSFKVQHEDTGIYKAIRLVTMSAIRPEVQHTNSKVLAQFIRSVACIRDTNDVSKMMAHLVKHGIPTCISMNIDVEHVSNNKEKQYIMSLFPGRLGLRAPQEYLFEKIPFQKEESLKRYRDLVNYATTHLELTQDMGLGIKVECNMAKTLNSLKVNETRYTLNGLHTEAPNVPWKLFFSELGLSNLDGFLCNVECPAWLSLLQRMFKQLTIDEWIGLLSLQIFTHALPHLPEPYYSKANILFHSKPISRQLYTLSILKGGLQDEISYLFAKNFLKGKKEAMHFVEEILKGAQTRAADIQWMDPKTRERVIKKIGNIKQIVFVSDSEKQPLYPKNLVDDSILKNIYIINQHTTQDSLSKIHKKAHISLIQMPPSYIINAYYYTKMNQIIIPAASFFFPFYDPKCIGWNYGGIGATIGHEIIHAFDIDGQTYDENGNNNEIWSTGDKRKYNAIIKRLTERFSKETVVGAHINGAKTVSENLADLGGIQVALNALSTRLKGLSPEKRLHELREFFISYATSWRTLTRSREALLRVYIDPHAPAEQRVDVIVSQMDEWYEAFGCKVGDRLYVKPEDRIHIF